MTKGILYLAASAALMGAAMTPPAAKAEVQYPWCAEYRPAVGGVNCGFVTYQQCVETISGVGGICYRNPAYFPPRERSRRR